MDFFLSISQELVASAGAAAIYYFLARACTKQPRRNAGIAAAVLFIACLIFTLSHQLLAQRFPQPWPYDLGDRLTAFLLAAPLLSGAIAFRFARCSVGMALVIALLSAVLNLLFLLLVGLLAFVLH